MLISQWTDGQATCLCNKKIKLLRLGYLWLLKLIKCFIQMRDHHLQHQSS